MSETFDLWVRNGRVVTCAGPDEATPEERLDIRERSAVGIRHGRIVYVGEEDASLSGAAERVLDARGGAVMPGLVDPHTHLVFAGSRVSEFARRMAGEDYRTIAAEGGGIAATVRGTREADDETLYALAERRARAMTRHGVTSVEVKSGYGLTAHDEARSLRVARRLDREGVTRTTATFLGAHAVPPERSHDRDGYVREVVEEMLPAVARSGLADSCDAYIDDGAFTLAEGRRVLSAAQGLGLAVRAHVGQFADLGGAELVAELGGLSADHVENISEQAMGALAAAGVVAVLLPGAWRTLRQTPPDVPALRAAGVRMAVGTDCNPGTSPCTDLPLCAALAVRDAGLTLEEAVLSVTVDAARAAGIEHTGQIVPGAWADLCIYDNDDPRALAYAIGDCRPRWVLRGGEIVVDADLGSSALW